MNNNEIAIVVLAYNRPLALKKLLNSLIQANYNNKAIKLIISIDKAEDDNGVSELVESFEWPYGDKEIILHKENLGLRKHVLKCGDLTSQYGSIIMLEDDIVVAPDFYNYAEQSIKFYQEQQDIAQISLYSYRVNEYTDYKPFNPIMDESDVLFIQTPSSWGQIWTAWQWKEFKEWYDKEEYKRKSYTGKLPEKILGWKESSWKKYFAMYMVDTKRYTVYPQKALSTNMGDKGTHHVTYSTQYQSILGYSQNKKFIFKKREESNSVYDSFMESILIKNYIEHLNLEVDYYGTKYKNTNKRYLLTTSLLPYKVINSWELALTPYELNILYDLKGQGIYLYDLKEKDKVIKNQGALMLQNIKYENPSLHKKLIVKSIKLFLMTYLGKISNRRSYD